MGLSLPSASTLTTNYEPTVRSESIALSFLSAKVSPGGEKLACDTHDASIAPLASSSLVVTTHMHPTIRPRAFSLPLTRSVAFGARPALRCSFRFSVSTSYARSVPLSSHICSS